MNERDERLGQVLRALEVPEHGPDFFGRLAQRLEQDAAPDWRARARGWKGPMLVGAAAVVVVVLAVSTWIAKSPTPLEVRMVSSTEVLSRVSSAFSSLHSLSGDVAIECAVPVGSCSPTQDGVRTTRQWSFVTTAAGDERITGIGRRDDLAYSASRREQSVVSDDGPPFAQVLSNLAPGPPDFANRSSVLRRDVATVVRAFLDTTAEVPVTDVTEQERPAWRLVIPVTPNKLAGPGGSGDQLEVIVDRQSGFPLRIVETLAGRFLDEVRLSNLVVDGPVDPGSFTLKLPAGAKAFRQDAGFHSATLSQVAAVVGYQPVLPTPTSLPGGYKLAEVTVASTAGHPGNEGLNPPSPNVVSVAYRRGFDRIIVTTRSTGTARQCSITAPGTDTNDCWADPVASGEGFIDEPHRFTVDAGALAGARAELVISPRGVPHVWMIDDRLVVTVAGDANAAELQRLAQSFAPAR